MRPRDLTKYHQCCTLLQGV